MRAGVVLDGPLEELPAMLTVEEAACVLRIGRSLAYQLANRYVTSGGIDGLPVVRLGGVLRVPGFAVRELTTTGVIVQLTSTPPVSTVTTRATRARRSKSVDRAQLSLLTAD
jgi:hypothetical protein